MGKVPGKKKETRPSLGANRAPPAASPSPGKGQSHRTRAILPVTSSINQVLKHRHMNQAGRGEQDKRLLAKIMVYLAVYSTSNRHGKKWETGRKVLVEATYKLHEFKRNHCLFRNFARRDQVVFLGGKPKWWLWQGWDLGLSLHDSINEHLQGTVWTSVGSCCWRVAHYYSN